MSKLWPFSIFRPPAKSVYCRNEKNKNAFMLFVVYMNCSLSTSRNNIRTTPPLPSSSYHDPQYQDGIKKAKKKIKFWHLAKKLLLRCNVASNYCYCFCPSPPPATGSGWMCLESKYECIWGVVQVVQGLFTRDNCSFFRLFIFFLLLLGAQPFLHFSPISFFFISFLFIVIL